jgi:CRP-like cAMP-binding protein
MLTIRAAAADNFIDAPYSYSRRWDRTRVGSLAGQLRSKATFADWRTDDVEALVGAAAPTMLPAQWAFIQEGTPADALYILLAGGARIFYGRRPVAFAGVGALVGETAYLHRSLRTATVSSLSPLKALRIQYDDLDTLLVGRPRLLAALTDLTLNRARGLHGESPAARTH